MPGIERITIVGAGAMGHGIAQVAAAAGIAVRLHDLSEETTRAALEALRAALDRERGEGQGRPATAPGHAGPDLAGRRAG